MTAIQAEHIRILHIFNDPKFSESYFQFLSDHNFDLDQHFLFHYRKRSNEPCPLGSRHLYTRSFFSPLASLRLLFLLFHAEKIIIHGLASPALLLYLAIWPKRIGTKSFWVIWGKDLYFYRALRNKYFYHRIYELLRRLAIPKIGHVVAGIPGEIRKANEWYGLNAREYVCFGYPSNIHNQSQSIQPHTGTRILLGNSADPSNVHELLLELLAHVDQPDVLIYSPLSYGDPTYAREVAQLGKDKLGARFVPMLELLPRQEYQSFLAQIDIGIFGQERQQAFGNILGLLCNGARVFVPRTSVAYSFLRSLNVHISCLDELEFAPLSPQQINENKQALSEHYSSQNLARQWHEIFEDTFESGRVGA